MTEQQPFSLLGNIIQPGKTERLSLEIAKLHTNTPIQIPVIVSHALRKGPTLLLLAGVHGDEINGVETIRRIIKKGWNKPQYGTVICVPVFNIFGFLNMSREFPDKKDLNRVFPGSKNGSLASQFAYIFMKKIAPLADVIIDFHTGGAQRYNYPQTRCDFNHPLSVELCKVFNAPLMVNSSLISKSIRSACTKLGKGYILFEGGKSHSIDDYIVESGILGAKRVMTHLGIRKFDLKDTDKKSFIVKDSKWIRAGISGMLYVMIENGKRVKKGDVLAKISDPYGKSERLVKSPSKALIFNVNEMPLVNKGDALFNIAVLD
ncbi:MAG: succinylglutamate desuccinylase/aspartoacylase family protein [Brumimicrobium sp.]|nr:succinylglutamate desuccinylase/aspartoacylase family protein [Brumimicrobium sp.]MCO5268153.1 succinylglutamate desuccinylase/aspartoacylase family protein [Brumimicrobium sp.]